VYRAGEAASALLCGGNAHSSPPPTRVTSGLPTTRELMARSPFTVGLQASALVESRSRSILKIGPQLAVETSKTAVLDAEQGRLPTQLE
jgi:hypothetical protein